MGRGVLVRRRFEHVRSSRRFSTVAQHCVPLSVRREELVVDDPPRAEVSSSTGTSLGSIPNVASQLVPKSGPSYHPALA
jgi:hypothetical protein